MHHDFWHQKWENNQIGFHLAAANPLLLEYLPSLQLPNDARIFLPLCGKTLDIGWLIKQGYEVVGAELSTIAVDALFAQLNLKPNITDLGGIQLYQAAQLSVFVGDMFALTPAQIGQVDAVYDRAAFVALPEEMRTAYSKQLMILCPSASQLLITLHYDQTVHQGPPFSITQQTVSGHYQDHYSIDLLASKTMPDGLKGQYPATEQVWLLKPE